MTMSQDQSSGAEGSYHKCVNETTVRDFNVAPELIYDHLLRSAEVRVSLPQWYNSLNYGGSREIIQGAFLASLLRLLRYLP